jgi:hypothetical protein
LHVGGGTVASIATILRQIDAALFFSFDKLNQYSIDHPIKKSLSKPRLYDYKKKKKKKKKKTAELN